MDTKQHESENHGNGEVNIYINNTKFGVRRGQHEVVELKKLGSVPLADELEELISGQLKPLGDNDKVKIEGDEHFISHPRDSASS